MRRIIPGILMLAVLGVLFCGCEKKNSAAYVFETGKTLHYRLWVNQQIETNSDIDNAVRISMRSDFDLTPIKVSADGETELKLVFTGASASATTQEGRQSIDMQDQLVNRELFIKMKRDGEIKELRLPELENRNRYNHLAKMRHVIMDMFTTLPSNLNNGTAWTRQTLVEEDFSPFGTVSTETKTSFVAGSEVEVWQQHAIEIAVNFDVRLGSEVDKEHKTDSVPEDGKPQSLSVNGGGTGSGKMYFNPSGGTCIGAAYETKVNMKTGMTFDDATKNTSSDQKIKTGIVLKLMTEKNAR